MGVYVSVARPSGQRWPLSSLNIAYFPYNKNESIIGNSGEAERKGWSVKRKYQIPRPRCPWASGLSCPAAVILETFMLYEWHSTPTIHHVNTGCCKQNTRCTPTPQPQQQPSHRIRGPRRTETKKTERDPRPDTESSCCLECT